MERLFYLPSFIPDLEGPSCDKMSDAGDAGALWTPKERIFSGGLPCLQAIREGSRRRVA